MDTKLKNKIATASGVVGAIIGIALTLEYIWRILDSRFADTFQLLLKLF